MNAPDGRTQALQRQGAADQISAILHERILAGGLKPGDPLRETELATEFHVARNTIREALRLLTRDGLASHGVHRGVTVRRFSTQEVTDIYDTRIIIQVASARRAGKITTAQRTRLDSFVQRGIQARLAGDGAQWLTQNMLFHQETVALLDNPLLDGIFATLVCATRLALSEVEREPSSRWDIDGNAELLKILEEGTAARYRAAITDYLTQSRANVAQRMKR